MAEQTLEEARSLILYIAKQEDCDCGSEDNKHPSSCKYLRRAFAGLFHGDGRTKAKVSLREIDSIEKIRKSFESSSKSLAEVKEWLDDWLEARKEKSIL